MIFEFEIALGNFAVIAEKKILIGFKRNGAAIRGVTFGFVRFIEMFAVDENFAARVDGNRFAGQTDNSFKYQRVIFISVKGHDIAAFRLVPFVGEAIDDLDLPVMKIRLHALAAHANTDQNDFEEN